jgi:hypothetical protein
MAFPALLIPEQCDIAINDKKFPFVNHISVGKVRKIVCGARKRSQSGRAHTAHVWLCQKAKKTKLFTTD